MSALEVRDLDVYYGELKALSGFNLSVEEGETVAVIGANGAGKSTLLRSICGILRPRSGSIFVGGEDVTHLRAYKRVRTGVALVPEGRRLFPSLTVEENLLTGTYRARQGPWTPKRVMELFDWMPERRREQASKLSGGQQQAVAIGRALVSNPRVLLIDELSLGLAPIVVKRVYEVIPQILREGTSVLLVEQDVAQALRVADRVTCLLEGRTVLEGKPAALTMHEIERAYFGAIESVGG